MIEAAQFKHRHCELKLGHVRSAKQSRGYNVRSL